MKKVSCIIPAYNEEKGIGHTLSVVAPLIGKNLFEVIVIDDCSTDSTKQIIKTFPAVTLLEHQKNGGKSKTVADGIKASKGDYIFLLDADLQFLNEKNIIDLIEPIEKDIAQVTISFRKNSWPLFPFKEIDYLSGERILPKDKIMPTIEKMAKLKSYGLEVFLNKIIISNHMSLEIVQWPNVLNVFSQDKHGWVRGIKTIAKIWGNVIYTVGFFGMYKQNIRMRKLLVNKRMSR